jgi:hypothetical protein
MQNDTFFEVYYWIFTKEDGLRIGVNEIRAFNEATARRIMKLRLAEEFGDVLHASEMD